MATDLSGDDVIGLGFRTHSRVSFSYARGELRRSRHAQELELRSLKQLINQLKEEIARFDAREAVTAKQKG